MTGGVVPHDVFKLFTVVGTVFVTEEDRPAADILVALDGVEALHVGLADLDSDLDADLKLKVGVEERAVALVGVEDLTIGTTGFAEAATPLEVGVDDLEGFDAESKPDFLVGVADLEAVGFCPSDNEDLLFLEAEECLLVDVIS